MGPRSKRKRTPARAPAPIEASLETVPDELALPGEVAILEAAAGDGGDKPPRLKIVAYTGGLLELSVWPAPVVAHLEGLRLPKSLPVLADHDRRRPLGHGSPAIVEGRLEVDGLVSMPKTSPLVRDFLASAKQGFPWMASIGARPTKIAYHDEGSEFEANGRTFKADGRGLYEVQEAALREVSVCTLGADEKTKVAVAARAAANKPEDENMNFDQWLKARGKNPAKLSDVERTDLQAQFDAEQSAPPPAPIPTPSAAKPAKPADPDAMPDAIRARAVEDERKRVIDIEAACKGLDPDVVGDLKAKAAAGEITLDALKTGLLDRVRASRPKAPEISTGESGGAAAGAVLEAACVLSAGLEKPEDHCEEKALEAAAKRFRGGIGLQELLLEAALANGYTGRTFRATREVLGWAFGRNIQASLSTINIGGILSNVANKFLLEGFFSVERVWRDICAVRNVSDFKTVTSYRLIGKDQYELVAPGGELKHGTLGEEEYTNKAETYGLLLSVDRRDIINDDLGAITTVPRKLGRGSGLKINDIFWTVFLANTAFFKTANKNYLTGTGSALTLDGLTAAEVAFMDQVDADKKPIGIAPQIILVPTALGAMATQLYTSLELRDTTASTKYPVNNPHKGKFRVSVSRYLANSAYTGYSAKAWYLLADARDLPVIEVAFLNGQESPTIETANADFSRLGVQMRGYHDFGVNLQDPKAGVKSKGEA